MIDVKLYKINSRVYGEIFGDGIRNIRAEPKQTTVTRFWIKNDVPPQARKCLKKEQNCRVNEFSGTVSITSRKLRLFSFKWKQENLISNGLHMNFSDWGA